MQFQEVIITNDGKRLLANASLNKKVVISKLLFTESTSTLTETMTKDTFPGPTWGNGSCDKIYDGGDGKMSIYLSASNELDNGYARGFGIFGRFEDSSTQYLMFVANALGDPEYVAPTSGAHSRFHLCLTIAYAVPNGSVIIEPGYAGLVSEEEFTAFAKRCVTTHSHTDSTVGENQKVYGIKRFHDGIELDVLNKRHDGLGRINLDNGDGSFILDNNGNSQIKLLRNNQVQVSGNLFPNQNVRSKTLGLQNAKWGYVYSTCMADGMVMGVAYSTQVGLPQSIATHGAITNANVEYIAAGSAGSYIIYFQMSGTQQLANVLFRLEYEVGMTDASTETVHGLPLQPSNPSSTIVSGIHSSTRDATFTATRMIFAGGCAIDMDNAEQVSASGLNPASGQIFYVPVKMNGYMDADGGNAGNRKCVFKLELYKM